MSFFAIPDDALPEHSDSELALNGRIFADDTYETLYSNLPELAEALRLLDNLEFSYDERQKKILQIILRAILEYHIIPAAAYDVITLGHNSTYATNLVIPGVLDSQPQRLKVEQSIIPPRTTVNFYAKIIRPNVKATNGKICLQDLFLAHNFPVLGIIHVLDKPLLPPPSIFQGLYMAPHFFSTFVRQRFISSPF